MMEEFRGSSFKPFLISTFKSPQIINIVRHFCHHKWDLLQWSLCELYNPYVIGENRPKVIKYLSSITRKTTFRLLILATGSDSMCLESDDLWYQFVSQYVFSLNTKLRLNAYLTESEISWIFFEFFCNDRYFYNIGKFMI